MIRRFAFFPPFRLSAFPPSRFTALPLLLFSAFPRQRVAAEAVAALPLRRPDACNVLLDISAEAFMQEGASAERRFAALPEKRQAAAAHHERDWRDYFGH